MSNMTIANNSSVGSGGAVYAAVGASVTIDNSILFGNGSTEIEALVTLTQPTLSSAEVWMVKAIWMLTSYLSMDWPLTFP